jgi:hypothetical protein
MRLIVVLAGAFGFFTVVIGSLAWEKPLESSLVNGIVSALVAGILFRWWIKLWISSLEQVSRQGEISAQQSQNELEQQSGSKPSESRRT